MPAAITDLIDRTTDSTTGRPVIATLASGKAIAASSISINDATNWTTTTAIHFSIYATQTVGGIAVKDPSTQTDWKGTLSGTTISNLTITGGTDRTYTAGSYVEITPTARWAKDLYECIIAFANQDGTLKSAPVQTALGLGASSLNGWNALGYAPSSVTHNGNRSYDLLFSGVDISTTISAGTRLRTTRTVAAANQCTTLNGTTQSFSKSSPAGMTFTDDFVVSAWIKVTAYPSATAYIVSRYSSGSGSGWNINLDPTGIIIMQGNNGGASNYGRVQTRASIPLNKWVHITGQLDMSAGTATTVTSYIMFDGVDIPCSYSTSGSAPSALVQAGNLEIGSLVGGGFFTGKIAHVAIFSAKVTQATMRGYTAQAMVGTETSLISAFKLSNTINDSNTTNANNLTANGSATTTTADSPYGGQADGTISTTLDYCIAQKVTFSTNTTITVQVPEGCTIPTTGGVSTVVYSANQAPYGMPVQGSKWRIETLVMTDVGTSIGGTGTWGAGPCNITVPLGNWKVGYNGCFSQESTVAGSRNGTITLSSTSPSNGTRSQDLSSIIFTGASTTACIIEAAKYIVTDLAAQTVYTVYGEIVSATGAETWHVRGDRGMAILFAENTYL